MLPHPSGFTATPFCYQGILKAIAFAGLILKHPRQSLLGQELLDYVAIRITNSKNRHKKNNL